MLLLYSNIYIYILNNTANILNNITDHIYLSWTYNIYSNYFYNLCCTTHFTPQPSLYSQLLYYSLYLNNISNNIVNILNHTTNYTYYPGNYGKWLKLWDKNIHFNLCYVYNYTECSMWYIYFLYFFIFHNFKVFKLLCIVNIYIYIYIYTTNTMYKI